MRERKLEIVSFALALLYGAAGVAKVLAAPPFVELFLAWGYPLSLMTAIGLFELIGAVGLLLPRIASVAALSLALLMVAAIYTHLFRGGPLFAFVPLGLMVALLWLAKRRLNARQSWVLPLSIVAQNAASPTRARAGRRAR